MANHIGTKIYYCNLTGNIIKIKNDMQGCVKETTFDEDYEIYKELNEREKESIGLIEIEYGQYAILSKNSTGVMVNLETKELIFSYGEIPQSPQEPNLEDVVKEQGDKISILESENADLLLDNAMKDLRLETLENDLADLTLEIAMIGGN